MYTDSAVPSLLIMFIPLILMTIPLAIICYIGAKEKGLNPVIFGVLGIIPLVNSFVAFYLILTPDRTVHDKLDRILAMLAEHSPPGGS